MAFLAPAAAAALPALAGSAGTAALGAAAAPAIASAAAPALASAAAPALASAAAPALASAAPSFAAYAMPAGAKALGSAMPWLSGSTTAASMAGPGAMNLSAMPSMIGQAAGSLPQSMMGTGFADNLMKYLPNMASSLQNGQGSTSGMSMPSAPSPNYSQNSGMSLTDMLNQRAQQRMVNTNNDMDLDSMMSMFNNRLG